MSDRFRKITQGLSTEIAKMHREMPEVMSGFTALKNASEKEGVLDGKTKELIAMSLAVAGHCQGCIGFHAKALLKHHATREELLEALSMAIYMGGGPSLMYAAEALEAFEEFSQA